ncbi:uncharacterized protein PV09_02738 [Verruconis gallopava]|uniref:non-specific serine/threonine protein kinase n=1 Tax=Verruconis gallopava TaxID=253628 RepID=A0A0D1XU11_9PEZI|nr:uncharacterized protein PV09_02738 [Verruconis gallopava]KIW06266.1 hypothetical protein PV09_02738 [Verruconis gallopava]
MLNYAAGHHGAGATSTHPGMFAPGTKVQVGKHRVVVEKYLSEGGFAHVYLVRDPQGDPRFNPAVLKRVAVPDKEALANMRTEVETMKKLKGHKHIVTYIDSHASQLQQGGYEVFLLMEFCNGGGLIDFMNTRLQHRLTEPEILNIFSDVALGVACMHYLKPPLLHRDLKVENVLITTSGNSRVYKLCDFGSTAPPRPAATNAAEGRLIEDDIQRHTTLQYRSPEMIDVYRRQPIDEKSDIWALGVLLYKLCYYTTPFEDQGQMAILNASFKFPSYPSFSERLKKLISSMLRENPQQRPNIYQVVREVCSMRNVDCPIQDIYATRTRSETRIHEQLPSTASNVTSPPVVGLSKVKSADLPSQTPIPDITPMRRGRPNNPGQALSLSARATPAGSRGTSSDPFAALDSKDFKVRSAAADELAAKFPSLDEFSLLHDQGAKFEFGDLTSAAPKQEGINKRVTEALADEAFGQAVNQLRLGPTESAPTSKSSSTTDLKRATSVRQTEPKLVPSLAETRSQPQNIYEPAPVQKRSTMVSTGVQTSPPPSPSPPKRFDLSSRAPIWRVPQHPSDSERSSSQPTSRQPISSFDAELPPRPEKGGHRSHLLDRHKTKSQTLYAHSPSSSRPSLEGQRPTAADLEDPISRSKSANARPRPSSVYLDSNLDYLKERESSRENASVAVHRQDYSSAVMDDSSDDDGPENPDSNINFLRDLEGSSNKRQSRRRSSGKSHRKSIPSISLSGTKSIITGKFSDAFKKFEGNAQNHESEAREDELVRNRVLTPITGSEATGTSGRSDEAAPLEQTEDLPPEVRRELERQQLEREEARVAAAAAAYKSRLANPSERLATQQKGSAIQNRVRDLLESTKEVQVTRTAEGYGRFTEGNGGQQRSSHVDRPPVARKPVGMSKPAVTNSTGPKPIVAPKPKMLRTGGASQTVTDPSDEDWEASFQRRYPSLAGLEMVETDIRPATRVKDV